MQPSKLPLKTKIIHILIGLPFVPVLIVLSFLRVIFTTGAMIFMFLDSRINHLTILIDRLYFLAISPFKK